MALTTLHPARRLARPCHLHRAAALACLAFLAALPGRAAEQRFGVGLHYYRALDDIGEKALGIHRDGVAGVLTYQYVPRGLVHFELDLEIYPDGFGGATDTALAPVGFVLLGSRLYAGVGVGVIYSSDFDGSFSDPFYAGRVGIDLLLLPHLHLDLNANYRARAFNQLDQVSTGTLTFAGMVRFAF